MDALAVAMASGDKLEIGNAIVGAITISVVDTFYFRIKRSTKVALHYEGVLAEFE